MIGQPRMAMAMRGTPPIAYHARALRRGRSAKMETPLETWMGGGAPESVSGIRSSIPESKRLTPPLTVTGSTRCVAYLWPVAWDSPPPPPPNGWCPPGGWTGMQTPQKKTKSERKRNVQRIMWKQNYVEQIMWELGGRPNFRPKKELVLLFSGSTVHHPKDDSGEGCRLSEILPTSGGWGGCSLSIDLPISKKKTSQKILRCRVKKSGYPWLEHLLMCLGWGENKL